MTRAANHLRAVGLIAACLTAAASFTPKAAAAPTVPPLIAGITSTAHVIKAGYYAPWPTACAYGSHYVCWRGSYGGRYCGCWAGGDRPACPAGYHFSCHPDAFGRPYCACY